MVILALMKTSIYFVKCRCHATDLQKMFLELWWLYEEKLSWNHCVCAADLIGLPQKGNDNAVTEPRAATGHNILR